MATFTMYDSTSAFDIPTTVEAVAGYVDGRYMWSHDSWDRFTRAKVVRRISVRADGNMGDVLDVEHGDARVEDIFGWIKRAHARGILLPWIYCSSFILELVQKAIPDGGESADVWCADWTGHPHMVPGCAATQYDHPPHSGGHYDLSLITWP